MKLDDDLRTTVVEKHLIIVIFYKIIIIVLCFDKHLHTLVYAKMALFSKLVWKHV